MKKPKEKCYMPRVQACHGFTGLETILRVTLYLACPGAHFPEGERREGRPNSQQQPDVNVDKGTNNGTTAAKDDRCKQDKRHINKGKVLVFSVCCLTAFITIGISFSLGSVYLDTMETFHTSRPLAALVQSLCVGIGFGAGIVTGPILGRLGGAITLMVGGLLCCAGCIGSSFAPNIYVLIACYGGITGAGVSCAYLASQVVMGTSFHKKRHIMVPVVSMCGGLGSTVMPNLFRFLVDEYTQRGMFLILAGVSFHCVLFGMVVKTFGTSRGLSGKDSETVVEVKDKTDTTTVQDDDKNAPDKVHELGKDGNRNDDKIMNEANSIDDIDIQFGDTDKNSSSFTDSRTSTDSENFQEAGLTIEDTKTETGSAKEIQLQTPEDSSLGGLEKRNTYFSSVTSISILGNVTNMHKSASVVTISESVEIFESGGLDPTMGRPDDCQSRTSVSTKRSRKSALSETFQVDLFRSKRYVLYTLICFTCFLSFNAPGIFLTDIGKGRGLRAEQGTQLLAIMYAFNLTGRGSIGVFQVIWKFPVLRLFGFVYICTGLAAFSFTLLDYADDASVFAALATVCAVYGLFLGACNTCGPLSCLEIVGANKYAAALGYQFFIVGLSTSVGGPLGGWIKDQTGSYNLMFYLALGQSLVSATTVLVASRSHKSSRGKKDRYEPDDTKGSN